MRGRSNLTTYYGSFQPGEQPIANVTEREKYTVLERGELTPDIISYHCVGPDNKSICLYAEYKHNVNIMRSAKNNTL